MLIDIDWLLSAVTDTLIVSPALAIFFFLSRYAAEQRSDRFR